jgi:hypothetical protein
MIGDQFRGLPMGELIGAPLMAACDAQVRLASATADFIKTVGFLPPKADDAGGVGEVRNVQFSFDRSQEGAVPDANGVVPSERVNINVPLLSVVKIPTLSIERVDVTFDMEVKESSAESSKENSEASMEGEAEYNAGFFKVKVKVSGSVSSARENTRSSDQSAKYHVQVLATDKGMPEGLARVLDIMQQAVSPRQIKKAA